MQSSDGIKTSSYLVNAVRAYFRLPSLGCAGMAKQKMVMFDKDETNEISSARGVNHQNRSGDG
ncbi:MAG: hypothetical protein EKK31_17035 [Hyphomicrobiales bacterium]|nr:MAG: hypothetical protein EKK31_17035 [Hyphomicrobiales bacterium]